MPATLSNGRTHHKTTGDKPRAPPTVGSKKTRVVARRRGRAKGELESDDEIEREVATDSESDDDASSINSVESDSDQEPAPSRHTSTNPRSKQSSTTTPSSSEAKDLPSSNAKAPDAGPTSFFGGGGGDWSEMVAEENVNGPADLPVIDFADFNGKQTSVGRGGKQSTRGRSGKQQKTVPPSTAPELQASEPGVEAEESEAPVASSSRPQQPPATSSDEDRRLGAHSARQAYQHRLDTDPSYVPVVGEFWSHDDRLMDKGLRSLSPWWRGRWQGNRGRGRGGSGFDRGFRGRGRGGFFQPPPQNGNHQQEEGGGGESGEGEVARIDREWGHDGFEEMKRKEEARQVALANQQQEQSARGGFGNGRGRGGGSGAFPPRGRGGFSARGGFAQSPTSGPNNAGGRPWFAMKPERMWTKQHEGFLHFDHSMKPRPGQGPALRVKLGDKLQIVRGAPKSFGQSSRTGTIKEPNPASQSDPDDLFVVRLPRRSFQENPVVTVEEPLAVQTAVLLPIEPSGAPPGLVHPNDTANGIQPSTELPTNPVLPELGADSAQEPQPITIAEPRPAPPVLPPLRTVFTPVPHASPSYSSPYGYAPPPLPPGVGLDQNGMPYELSTGRPVYLQGPPVPVPIYNPRPVMHHMAPPPPPPGLPYAPSHRHHHTTVEGDFIAQIAQPPPSTSPPMNMGMPMNGFVDPSTGTPIFSFPRQSSRIEIRAPTEYGDPTGKGSVRKPSGLRTSAATFEPSPTQHPTHYHHQSNGSIERPAHNGDVPMQPYGAPPLPSNGEQMVGEDGQLMSHHPGQQMPAYNPYAPAQYYYPDAYGYPPYMDMSQPPQQYGMYPHDVPQGSGAVYY